jgi:sulfopropanediol 3-dehydrogenase
MIRLLKSARPEARDTLREDLANEVRSIIVDIEQRGDDAVREYSTRFDDWSPICFEQSKDTTCDCVRKLPTQLVDDLRFAIEQIRNFAELQRGTLVELERETLPGIVLGHKHIPVSTVGCYVPGGNYPLLASALMTIVTARVAGVKRIQATTPPFRGKVSEVTIAAMTLAGADRIFCLGGAQAIAAMAFGAVGFETVDMIVGPGNVYVTEAKRQLFGRIGIDLLAGPTEVLIIADETADHELCAVDLLGQAEHGPTSKCILLTNDESLAAKVAETIEQRLRREPSSYSKTIAAAAWQDHGQIIVCDHFAEMIEKANDLAFEHVQVMAAQPSYFLERLTNYGSLFLGEHVNVAYGDKVIGTNHVLPTSRASRFTGGLWVGSFLKTCTYQTIRNADESIRIGEVCSRICAAEGFPAHKEQADIRVRRHFRGAQPAEVTA